MSRDPIRNELHGLDNWLLGFAGNDRDMIRLANDIAKT